LALLEATHFMVAPLAVALETVPPSNWEAPTRALPKLLIVMPLLTAIRELRICALLPLTWSWSTPPTPCSAVIR
jgi:hypothetical protein